MPVCFLALRNLLMTCLESFLQLTHTFYRSNFFGSWNICGNIRMLNFYWLFKQFLCHPEHFILGIVLTFSSHTEYVKRESNVIVKDFFHFFIFMEIHILYVLHLKKSFFKFHLSVRLAVDSITFKGVCGSKQHLVGVFRI